MCGAPEQVVDTLTLCGTSWDQRYCLLFVLGGLYLSDDMILVSHSNHEDIFYQPHNLAFQPTADAAAELNVRPQRKFGNDLGAA